MNVAIQILICRANVLFVDLVTPPLINVQTRYGFSVRCCCNMALLTKNLMRSFFGSDSHFASCEAAKQGVLVLPI